jgi:hypothetical protein
MLAKKPDFTEKTHGYKKIVNFLFKITKIPQKKSLSGMSAQLLVPLLVLPVSLMM